MSKVHQKTPLAIAKGVYGIYGGAEKLCLEIIQVLLSKGFSIELITWAGEEWPLNNPLLKKIEIPNKPLNRKTKLIKFNNECQKIFNSKNYHTILSFDHVENCTHIHGGGGCHISFLQSIKNFESNFAYFLKRINGFHRAKLKIEEKVFANCKKIHCCSKNMVEDLNTYYDINKAWVCANGFDYRKVHLDNEEKKQLKKKIIEKHNLRKGKEYLLFIGSDFKRKGLDFSFEILNQLPEKYELLVIGNGKAKKFSNQIDQLNLKTRVHFLGIQENAYQYGCIAKGLLLLSRFEPFGLVGLEANAWGLPVLSSEFSGYADVIKEDQTGTIYPLKGTLEQQQKALTEYSNLLENLKEDQKEKISYVSKKYDHSIFMESFIEDFLELND